MKVKQGNLTWRLTKSRTWRAIFRLESPRNLRLSDLYDMADLEEEDGDFDEVREFLHSQRLPVFGEIISIESIPPKKVRGEIGWFRIEVNIL